ncbi:MaoC/PaaZ C-terminal domain-containing protein [Chloroflexota bacterium]
MTEQIFYEDIEAGTEMPALIKHPSTRQLVKWAGASGDYYELHYDKDFAQRAKLPGVIVHGMLQMSFLGQLMTDWIGNEGTLKKMNCNFTAMLSPGADVACKGRVSKKHVEGGEHLVECELWLENSKGEKTTQGTAVVALPSKGSGG